MFGRKMMSMLTGLKMSSLTLNVYFTDSNTTQKGKEPHGTEFWRSWNAEMK